MFKLSSGWAFIDTRNCDMQRGDLISFAPKGSTDPHVERCRVMNVLGMESNVLQLKNLDTNFIFEMSVDELLSDYDCARKLRASVFNWKKLAS